MPEARAPLQPDPGLVCSAAHVFVADLESPRLTQADAHHLERTLRLRAGETVSASDGAGRWRPCKWLGAGPAGHPAHPGDPAHLEVDGPVVVVPVPSPRVTIGFALTKGDRPELVVRGLTEIGVDRILPLVAARSVVRWEGERGAHHLARLTRIAREAAMQSRRVWLPSIAPVAALAALMSPATAMAHPGGGVASLERPTILVGPEGGWDEAELAGGSALVNLGETVLRAETAALAAGIVLCSLRSGVVRPVSPADD